MAFPLKKASLEGLPAELFDDVCSHLSQQTLTVLARVSKAMNDRIQNPLYYHASVRGFSRLALLVRTMSDAARYDRRGDVISKNIHDLRLMLDPKKEEGNRATAVVLGRMVASIARNVYCPKIRTHLVLENASCSGPPIASFYTESFPRVTTLILHTGPGESSAAPSQPSLSRRVLLNARAIRTEFPNNRISNGNCGPSQAFWTGIFNGSSFPNLEEVEIHHVPTYTVPWSTLAIPSSELRGLRNIKRLAVDSAPELNETVLMSALQCAPNLKHLELRNILALSYSVLAKLLTFALPNLDHLTLHTPIDSASASRNRESLHDVDPLDPTDPTNAPPHLCPLIREFGKNIPHLDIFLPYMCRDLFLSPGERHLLNQVGVKFEVGGRSGEKTIEFFDAQSTCTLIAAHRKQVANARFQAAVRENIAAAGGGKAVTLAEYQEAQKRVAREREIRQGMWNRTVRIGKKMCRAMEAWEEMGVLAGLEEEGIKWVLGHERLNLGGIYGGGRMGIDLTYDELFPPLRRPDGHDHNDDML